jgi:hypothetical protein
MKALAGRRRSIGLAGGASRWHGYSASRATTSRGCSPVPLRWLRYSRFQDSSWLGTRPPGLLFRAWDADL